MKLGELTARLTGAEVGADPAAEVNHVTHDSRAVRPGSLFVAIRGLVTDGNRFAAAAREKGAVAVVSEAPAEKGVPWIRVPDARVALAVMAAAVLGDPASALQLVGVTGTNGKTTTTYLIESALREAGHRVGLVGTVEYRVAGRAVEASRTTPESSDLHALFRQMVDERCTHAVLEVSSHSLELKRVHGCFFRVAVFTNLTRDHLDFHGDMDRYFAAKRLLFDTLLRADGHAVINLDDDRAAELIRATRGHVWTYSLKQPADLRARDVSLSLEGTRFVADTPVGSFPVSAPLIGRFNVKNLLAALGAALALGVPPETALRGLGAVGGVPGRLEPVRAGQDFTVVVDYAHTDDALRNVLETVRDLRPRRIITVFGAGGDRDRTKRPLMGAVASRLSDVVVVTSDNPRSEPPEAIIDEVERGMNGAHGAPERHRVVDRREAIERALSMARPGDAVVIAGKGHEPYQVLRDRTIPFDDRRVAREILERHG
ncbi:MAG TPA: UDP-N-acetylmuramoyl-L-alanyl-D-glutamate--2,6-diaminopimelate ligase [Vicinamibacteria bacterium]